MVGLGLAVVIALGLTVGLTRLAHDPGVGDERPTCADRVAQLAPRARLAQRLMVGVDPTKPDAARAAVADHGVGGVFIGGTATNLLKGDALAPMRAASPLPVFVAVDEEGGRVQRIDELDGSMPSARVMAQTMTPDQVHALAKRRAEQLRARGVTLAMSPVLDMTSQPRGVIGDRSFGTDPAKVTEYAGAFAAGLRDAGMLPVFKHFPGHGRASGDSHTGAVTTPPLDALRTSDLEPYRRLLPAGPSAVLLGHLNVPGLTGNDPATLSPAAYRLLRQELGFNGLVFTDDLGAMKAVTDRYKLPDAVLAALRAGADVALWTSGDPVGPVLDRLQVAADAGQLPGSDQATARVLAAKGVCSPAGPDPS